MRKRRELAAAVVCLALAGCAKAAQKPPLVEDRADARLVDRLNGDLNRRLGGYQDRLLKVMESASAANLDFKAYTEFERSYLAALKGKCEGTHGYDLQNLHGEVMEWRSKAMDRLDRVSFDITSYISELESERLSMDETDGQVGPVISKDNRVFLDSLLRLSMNLRKENSGIAFAPVPDPSCADKEAAMAQQGHPEKQGDSQKGRAFKTELEDDLPSEKGPFVKGTDRWGYGSPEDGCSGREKKDWGYGSPPESCTDDDKRPEHKDDTGGQPKDPYGGILDGSD